MVSREEKAREVILDLVRWADVLTEAFSPKAMRAWGLDWDTLRAVNPRLVMLSPCLMGQTGPLAAFAGFGNLAGAVAGFYDTCGWADRAPAGPFGAYTDYVPRASTRSPSSPPSSIGGVPGAASTSTCRRRKRRRTSSRRPSSTTW